MASSSVKPQAPEPQVTRVWQKIGLIAKISSVCRQRQPDQALFEEVLTLIRSIIPFDAATLYLDRPDQRHLTPAAQLSNQVQLPSPFRVSDTDKIPRRPLIWPAAEDNDFGDDGAFVTTLAVPLLIEDEVIGVLNLGSCHEGVLSERLLQLLEIVADQLAVSIERINRVAEIEAQNEALHHAHGQLIANQQRIIEAEKLSAVVEVAATVNHEINNPLAVIVGQIQCLMYESSDLRDKTIERLRRVEQAALRIAEINRQLLQLENQHV